MSRIFLNFKHRYIVLIIIAFLFLSTRPVNAMNETSGQIDGVILETEQKLLVEVPIDEYVKLYFTKRGNTYEFLERTTGGMYIAAIRSGKKYIDIDEYIKSYFKYSENLARALEKAEPLDEEMTSKIKDISEYWVDVEVVRMGDIEGTIKDNKITIRVPKEKADSTIGYIQLVFSKEVKLLQIDDQPLSVDVINRFKQNGYDILNEYYDDFKVRTSWEYSKLARMQSSTSYTVISKDGYKAKFYVELIIEK